MATAAWRDATATAWECPAGHVVQGHLARHLLQCPLLAAARARPAAHQLTAPVPAVGEAHVTVGAAGASFVLDFVAGSLAGVRCTELLSGGVTATIAVADAVATTVHRVCAVRTGPVAAPLLPLVGTCLWTATRTVAVSVAPGACLPPRATLTLH